MLKSIWLRFFVTLCSCLLFQYLHLQHSCTNWYYIHKELKGAAKYKTSIIHGSYSAEYTVATYSYSADL